MAVKSSGQVTIIDITDGYTVGQTTDSWTIPADSESGSNQAVGGSSIAFDVYAYRGSTKISSHVGNITYPSGITGTITHPTVGTIEVPHIVLKTGTGDNALTGNGMITIPVSITHTDNQAMTFNCNLTYAVARTGSQGEKGATGNAGADAIVISITASPGTVIRNTSSSVTLTAHVYKAGNELTLTDIQKLGTLKWYKDPSTALSNNNKLTYTVQAADVQSISSYTVKLEG